MNLVVSVAENQRGEAEEPYTIDWQQGVAKENDRAWVVDKPGRTRALTANRTLAVFGGNNTSGERDVAAALTAHPGRYDFETESLVVAGAQRASQGGADATTPATYRQSAHFGLYDEQLPTLRAEGGDIGGGSEGLVVGVREDITGTLTASYGSQNGNGLGEMAGGLIPVGAEPISVRTAQTSSNGWGIKEGVTGTLDNTGGGAVTISAGVRRLTPVECERLQGFPDNWTAHGVAGPQSDSHRYRQMGNAICVPVMWWIGTRIVRAHEEA